MARQKGSWKLPGNREAILQASLDLIISSDGPIEIFSGGSSWVRELQIGLLYASLAKRSIRILCEQEDETESNFAMRKSAALASGATVAITKAPIGIQELWRHQTQRLQTLSQLDRDPTLHGLKLSSPHEKGVLGALTTLFNQQWNGAKSWRATVPEIQPSSKNDDVAKTLKKAIPAYGAAASRSKIFRLIGSICYQNWSGLSYFVSLYWKKS